MGCSRPLKSLVKATSSCELFAPAAAQGDLNPGGQPVFEKGALSGLSYWRAGEVGAIAACARSRPAIKIPFKAVFARALTKSRLLWSGRFVLRARVPPSGVLCVNPARGYLP